jgi:surface-adhesin protein E
MLNAPPLRRAAEAAILALIAMTTAAAATVASWTKVAVSPDGLLTFYADVAHIRGNHVRAVRLLYDYREVQQDPDTLEEHRSSIVSALVDCATSRIGVTKSENFSDPMGRGKPTNKTATQDPEMHVVAEETIDAKILDAVCRGRHEAGAQRHGGR